MSLSLQGLRVLNTRPKAQAQALSQCIRQAGGQSIDVPALAIEFLAFQQPPLDQLHIAIFTSPNAVTAYFQNSLMTWPENIKVIAIGNGTAKALAHYNIGVHAIPPVANSEHLLGLPDFQQPNKQCILLVKGENGRLLIAEELINKGATLKICTVYRRIMPSFNPQQIKSIWQDDLVDIILLTSEQSIRHLLTMFNDGKVWFQQKPCLVISSRLAQVAASLGMKHVYCTTPNELINALLNYANKD